jgi:hypothetical protein
MAGEAGGHPQILCLQWVLSQHLRPQRQTGNQFRCPRPFHKQMTLYCCPLSLVATYQKFSPKKVKFRHPEFQENSGARNFAPTRDSLFFQLSSKDLVAKPYLDTGVGRRQNIGRF